MDVGKIIICLICFGFGFPVLGISLSMIRRTIHLLRNGIRTEGRVTGHYKDPDPESDVLLEVVFTHLGVEHQCRMAHDIRVPQINDSVSLIYDPDDLKVVSGTSFGQLWFGGMTLFVIGSMVINFGFAVAMSGK